VRAIAGLITFRKASSKFDVYPVRTIESETTLKDEKGVDLKLQ
jgi:hypothetical protein